ncbi:MULTISPECIES: LysM peptidoglycan-binding domain-containing protein [Streptococcus]|jgi:lysM domain-containing protein|uniref:LysM peptidoglycan-binding domain-containing protein n=1 Tax=Streptococcus gordonii TaxID=1302 RepID=A0AB35FQ06_STRGN|nr:MULTISPECIES: LysM domain-containing protein [Streptococcus]ARC46502.1 LysM peptidoglycan-binding domain-containing protein [Streptococcus gordonii]MBS6245103.1 LysM peptidoglycan-binding domain-containing protein [Streptococcus sp.]MBW7663385.1 LysM peptidoglycan-binding domain-containing protein [Streptococcus gordonii]MBZ2126577.1 LysM peptidoglycan-binding domain-containing protein [Streptococcus gordonii]MBZ2128591.1 LysM peptidoglycan-binding domain-containing protein [Streptococcus g
MKINKKMLFASTVALSVFPLITANAEEESQNWTARTVDQIKADITSSENQQTYTVQYGDTLGTIAEAFDLDVNVLAHINAIANIDLIYPNTVLNITTNDKNEITGVEITSPQATRAVTGPVSEPAPATPVQPEAAPAETTAPSTEANAEVPAAPVTDAPVAPAPVEEQASSDAPAVPAEAQSAPEAASSQVAAAAEVSEPQSAEPITEPAAPATPAQPEATQAEAVTQAAPQLDQEQVNQDVTNIESPTYTAPAVATQTSNNAANEGLRPQTAALKEEIAAKYGITEFSLYRPGDSGDHGKGLAADFIVGNNTELGNQVAADVTSNMTGRGISYVIWQQKFYAPFDSIYGPANTWNQMPDRGSVTENHYDHVHVSMNE